MPNLILSHTLRASLTASLVMVATDENALAFSECVSVKYHDTPVCLDAFACTEMPKAFARWITPRWTISSTQALLEVTTTRISEAMVRCEDLSTVGIIHRRIIIDVF
jgi:hypothetical protein